MFDSVRNNFSLLREAKKKLRISIINEDHGSHKNQCSHIVESQVPLCAYVGSNPV